MKEINACVVVVTKFCRPNSEKFQKYINYIDRDEAVRTEHSIEYNLYQDYMGNPEKTTGLFTSSKDMLSVEDKKKLKQGFEIAQDNGSLMWQTVISFDNQWLEQNGLYHSTDKTLDEKKIKEVARSSIQKMLKAENLENAMWSAAIHYNTDNIHIHVATVEVDPMREKKEYIQYHMVERDGVKRKEPLLNVSGEPIKKEEYVGRFKLKSIKTCKRMVVNQIMNDRENNIKINTIIRDTILKQKRENPLYTDPELRNAFLKLYQKLPDVDRKLWNYNSNIMQEVRGEIDQVSMAYIQKYHSEEYSKLQQMLKIESENYKQAYGQSEGKDYEESKLRDLYARLGNAVLKECRYYDQNMDRVSNKENHIEYKGRKCVRGNFLLGNTLRRLKKSLKSEWEKQRNEREHELLTYNEEYER